MYGLSPAPIIMALIIPYKKVSKINPRESVKPAVPIRFGFASVGFERSVFVMCFMFLVSLCVLILGVLLHFSAVFIRNIFLVMNKEDENQQ